MRREGPASVLAKCHGISENGLHLWREEFNAVTIAPPSSVSPFAAHDEPLHQRFAWAHLSGPYLPGPRPDVSATLTTIAIYDGSLQWSKAD
jgi:hypothetical protein